MESEKHPLQQLSDNISHAGKEKDMELQRKIDESIFAHITFWRRKGWTERRIRRELKKRLA
jgi:hypothetical protein